MNKEGQVGIIIGIVAVVLVIVGGVVAIVVLKSDPCEEDWTCDSWGDCIDGEEFRNCVDGNKCGTTEEEPLTTRTCEVACEETWDCGDWWPCVNGTQSRECNDTNNCGTATNMPNINQNCTDVVENLSITFDEGWALFEIYKEGVNERNVSKIDDVTYLDLAKHFNCSTSDEPEVLCSLSDEEFLNLTWNIFDEELNSSDQWEKEDFNIINANRKQIYASTEIFISNISSISNGFSGHKNQLFFIKNLEANVTKIIMSSLGGTIVKDTDEDEIRDLFENSLNDTDKDGIPDDIETNSGDTNPNKTDTDNDSWWDGIEYVAETDFKDPLDFPFVESVSSTDLSNLSHELRGVWNSTQSVGNCTYFASNLSSCSSYKCNFTHILTQDNLTKGILGESGGKCHSLEQMPNNGEFYCQYNNTQLVDVSNYYDFYDERCGDGDCSIVSNSSGEFIDNILTPNPLQDMIESEDCVFNI